jgi:hypothetical protein
MADPRGATRRQALQKFQNPVDTTDSRVTGLMDATNTVEIIELAIDAEKVSFQADGSLAGTVEFSISGIDYVNSTAIGGANAIVTFNTHMVSSLRVTRTGGSGKLHVLAA